MQITGDWLTDPAAQAVLQMLEQAGHQAFVVGGCVRNALAGLPVADVDITTDAWPKQVSSLAQSAGFDAVPTGIDHGTVTVVANGTGFEITTFRKDIETDGRRAVIAFADRLEIDAHRRDFTMNALYADRQGYVTDPVGGVADLSAGRVRFIDRAEDRIHEDYLRILRFFRFQAWFGDPASGIDADTLAACAKLADGIELLSKERIGAEMRKLLAPPDPAPSVAAMAASGVLLRVLPGATAPALAVLVHLEKGSGQAPSWQRRLACLGGEGVVTALRLSRAEARYQAILRGALADGIDHPELAYRHGAEAGRDLVLLRAAVMTAPLPQDWQESVEFAARQIFPLRATDITTGETGPALGERLKRAEARWIASGFSLSKEALLD